ncbi:MAG: DUF86 domain-containing protein [Bacteroidota bacterium]|nr:DUF86 domain-containing protein [Bacteroidota bacterium]
MTEAQKKLLTDIWQAVLHIDVHLKGRRDRGEFVNDITQQRAVERELEIIGEATNKLIKLQPDFPLSSARKIINLRNRVIHAYDDVNLIIVWKVIITDIPVLFKEVEELLSKE